MVGGRLNAALGSLLRALNVGATNRCPPAFIAKQLAKFDIVNIGAIGTFVEREK